MKAFQINGPAWIDSDRWDIAAKIPDGVSDEKVPEMLQGLLADRFKMSTRKESKDLPIYALIVGKNGPKLKPAEENAGPLTMTAPDGSRISIPQPGNTTFRATTDGGGGGGRGMMMMDSSGRMQMRGMTMPGFAESLSRLLDRPVFDMTQVDGKYDISLEVSMEDLVGMKRMVGGGGGAVMMRAGGGEGSGGPAPEASPHGSIFSAVQQLGLKLDPRKAPVETVAIASIERPTEN
jgi:uncharacterized protein (TIGR03435 family)